MEDKRVKYLEAMALEEALARDAIKECKRNIKILKDIISGAFKRNAPAAARCVTAGLRRNVWRYQQYIKLHKKHLPMRCYEFQYADYKGYSRDAPIHYVKGSLCPSCGVVHPSKYGFKYCAECGQRFVERKGKDE